MITTFKITDRKAIRFAECVSVPRVMMILGQNGVGKSTFFMRLSRVCWKMLLGTDISPSGESPQNEHYRDEPSSRITSVLSRVEIARRNIIAASSLLDNKNIAEYTSISNVYEPLNKLLNMLLPHLKFEREDISDTDSPKCIFSKDTQSGNSHSTNQVDIDKLSRGEIG
jgi:ABC-type branched-subunit amino acid transport system ATPase component